MDKKTNTVKRSLALLLIVSLFVCVNSGVAFSQTQDTSQNVNYSMSGTNIIEKLEFNDVDGQRVNMDRVIYVDGTAILTVTKDGVSTVSQLTGHDYDLFYLLANPSQEVTEIGHENNLTRGKDLTGSQYKHVFISSKNYTINNTAVQQIIAGGVSTAAGILIGYLALPGGTALALGSLVYTVCAALSPYKVVVSQSLYEVFFSYDNIYYTHCYHEIIKSYDTGNHLVETRREYYQAVGG